MATQAPTANTTAELLEKLEKLRLQVAYEIPLPSSLSPIYAMRVEGGMIYLHEGSGMVFVPHEKIENIHGSPLEVDFTGGLHG